MVAWGWLHGALAMACPSTQSHLPVPFIVHLFVPFASESFTLLDVLIVVVVVVIQGAEKVVVPRFLLLIKPMLLVLVLLSLFDIS